MAKNKELQGLGGWLVVVGFNVVTTPLFLVAEVYPLFVAIFSEGGLTTVPPPGSKSSHPFWKPLLFTEVGVISAFVLASLPADHANCAARCPCPLDISELLKDMQ